MDKEKNAGDIRNEFLAEYYPKIHPNYLYQRDTQGVGIRYFHRSLEKFWKERAPEEALEIKLSQDDEVPKSNFFSNRFTIGTFKL